MVTSRKRNAPCVPPCGTSMVNLVHGVVPTSVCIAYRRVARNACSRPWKGSHMCSQMARISRCGVFGKARLMSRDVMMRPFGSMFIGASCIKIALQR